MVLPNKEIPYMDIHYSTEEGRLHTMMNQISDEPNRNSLFNILDKGFIVELPVTW